MYTVCICDVHSALVYSVYRLLFGVFLVVLSFALPFVLPACVSVVFEEPVGVRVGVFLFSLSVTLASVLGSSCSSVLWANRVQSCLSVSPRLGFLSPRLA